MKKDLKPALKPARKAKEKKKSKTKALKPEPKAPSNAIPFPKKRPPKMFYEFPDSDIYSKLKSLKDRRLQAEVKKWYKRLAKEGFKEIEAQNKLIASGKFPTLRMVRAKDHNMVLNDVFKASVNPANIARYERLHLVSVYLNSTIPPKTQAQKRKHLILKHYANGHGIYTVAKLVKAEIGKKGNSVWSIHYQVAAWYKAIVRWNSIHPEGYYKLTSGSVSPLDERITTYEESKEKEK